MPRPPSRLTVGSRVLRASAVSRFGAGAGAGLRKPEPYARAAMGERVIGVDDPMAADVQGLLEVHLAFNYSQSPPEDVFALDAKELLADDITFVSMREDGELLGVGALREIDAEHAEIKSMHTAARARGTGVARALLAHLIALARARGYTRVSLETGTMEGFAPAHRLYASFGFERCPPFEDYPDSPNSMCMTLEL
jgi:putative acetyltransferase